MIGDCIPMERASKRKHTGYQYQAYGSGNLGKRNPSAGVPQSALGGRWPDRWNLRTNLKWSRCGPNGRPWWQASRKGLNSPLGSRRQGSRSPQPHLEDGSIYRACRPTKLDKIKNFCDFIYSGFLTGLLPDNLSVHERRTNPVPDGFPRSPRLPRGAFGL